MRKITTEKIQSERIKQNQEQPKSLRSYLFYKIDDSIFCTVISFPFHIAIDLPLSAEGAEASQLQLHQPVEAEVEVGAVEEEEAVAEDS